MACFLSDRVLATGPHYSLLDPPDVKGSCMKRRGLIGLLCFVFLCASWSNLLAAPEIRSVKGVATRGSKLVARGAGFGANQGEILLWDDFERGTPGENLTHTPEIGSWKKVTSPQAQFSTAHKNSGRQSAYAWHDDSHQWSNFTVSIGEVQELYIGFWFRYSIPPGKSGQSKLCQIWGTYRKGDYNPGIMTGGFAGDWWASYIALESGLDGRITYPRMPAQNQWHHFEAILKQSTPNVADGRVELRVDGKAVYFRNPVKTREKHGQRWNLVNFFTGMTNWHSRTETYIDDCYLARSWARVELGDAETYPASRHRAIQIPVAWSDTEVTFGFNPGSLDPSQMTYLYVIDAAGNVNSKGFPIPIFRQ